MVEICYQNFPDLSEVNESFINSWFFDVVSRFDKQLGDVTLIFCSDDYLLDINRTYLNHDFYTDIITFDYSNLDTISGDLFISVDRVRENAIDLQQQFQDELHRVCVHGILHLIGFKDKSDDESFLMRNQENAMLDIRMFHVKHLKS